MLGETQAFGGEAIEVRRREPLLAVAAQVAEAEIVARMKMILGGRSAATAAATRMLQRERTRTTAAAVMVRWEVSVNLAAMVTRRDRGDEVGFSATTGPAASSARATQSYTTPAQLGEPHSGPRHQSGLMPTAPKLQMLCKQGI
jgi:hypothetical protein